MTTDVISAGEAWEAVERLKPDISYNWKLNEWCAAIRDAKGELGWGATPLEAVAHLLARIGEAANKTEAANG